MNPVMAMVLVLAGLFLIWFVFRGLLIRRRFREVGEFIEEINSGNLKRRMYLKGGGGFARVMTGLSGLAASLEEKTGEAGELRDRLDIMLGSIPDGIAVIDSKDRVKSVNSSLERLFQVSAQTFGTRTLSEALGLPQLNALITSVKLDMEQKRDTTYLDSEDRFMELIATPFTSAEGDYAGSVIVLRDVTAQNKIDQIRRDFVANVSHELKTPVTAIKGYTETLLDGAVEDRKETIKFLNTIKFQTERMESLIRDLITLSKIEFGAMPVEKRPISLEDQISKVFAGFQERAAEKGLYLKKDIHADCNQAEADPDRLLQIFINLLDNAIKYTEKGGVVVRARMLDGTCVLSVEDTGAGVPKKYLSRLGERFFRVDPSRSRELGGTGLGLAIVKHLVLAHGWRMTIESDLGKGTAIKIRIPRPV